MEPIKRDSEGNWWLALPQTATVHDIARIMGILYGEESKVDRFHWTPGHVRNPPNPDDDRVCAVCDGGPGNNCACSCGMREWEGDVSAGINSGGSDSPEPSESLERLRYYVNNPSAWEDGFNQNVSDAIESALTAHDSYRMEIEYGEPYRSINAAEMGWE